MHSEFQAKSGCSNCKGGYFGINIFDKILAQGGVGIRYYYVTNNDGSLTLFLAGVNSAGSDMIQGVIGEETFPCAPFCGSTNQLSK